MEKAEGKRKKGWVFWLVLLGIVLLNAACIVFVLSGLWNRLEVYEANSPTTAMQAFFKDIQEGRTQKIVAGLESKGLNTPEDYAAWLLRTFSGDTADYRFAPMQEENTTSGKPYAVYDGDGQRKGVVRLFSGDGENGPWTVRPDITYLEAYTIQAPAYVQVYLNGRVLPDSARTTEEEQVALFDSQRDENRIPKIVTYVVEDLLGEPIFTAQTPEGQPCAVTLDNETRQAVVRVPVAEEERMMCEGLLETASKLYARYISQDASLNELMAHVYKDTDFYDAVRSYDGKYYNKHISYAFENFTISNVEWYAADTFAGDVSFDYVVRRTHDTHTFPTRYRVGFQQIDGRYQLVELRIQ